MAIFTILAGGVLLYTAAGHVLSYIPSDDPDEIRRIINQAEECKSNYILVRDRYMSLYNKLLSISQEVIDSCDYFYQGGYVYGKRILANDEYEQLDFEIGDAIDKALGLVKIMDNQIKELDDFIAKQKVKLEQVLKELRESKFTEFVDSAESAGKAAGDFIYQGVKDYLQTTHSPVNIIH